MRDSRFTVLPAPAPSRHLDSSSPHSGSSPHLLGVCHSLHFRLVLILCQVHLLIVISE